MQQKTSAAIVTTISFECFHFNDLEPEMTKANGKERKKRDEEKRGKGRREIE